jgi:hypothetical protein
MSEQREILLTVGDEVIEKIDAAIAVGWMSMTVHMKVADAIRAKIGSERNIELWRETMTETYDRVLLRGFIDASVDLFGLTPASLFRQGPYIHRQLTRGLGVLTVEMNADGESGTIDLVGFPAKEFDLDCYAEGLQGCLESSITRGRGRGSITLTEIDKKRGDLRFHAVWTSRGSLQPPRG